MEENIALANTMADISGEIIKKYYRQPFEIERKDDDTPVTIADRAVEKALRKVLEVERPDDGILGEEFPPKPSQSGRTWVLDPIDGTKSFTIGRPTFGTLIALCDGETPVLGVIDQPILNERWVGVDTKDRRETTLNGAKVTTRRCNGLDHARIGSTSPNMFPKIPGYGRAYELFETTGHRIIWGGDCYMYGLLASGYMDVVFEEDLSPYDYAALAPVIKGAGGHISDWRGLPLSLSTKDNPTGKVIAVGDQRLWPKIEHMIRKSPY